MLKNISPLGNREYVKDEVTLYDSYKQSYQVVSADTPELLSKVFQLRYQVYCVENAFEDPAQQCDLQETDQFDNNSVHSLLIHRETRTVAGTVRLILPQPDSFAQSFPIQSVCSHHMLFDHRFFKTFRPAEISRFAISKKTRRDIISTLTTSRSENSRDQIVSDLGLARYYITLGLVKAVLQMSEECGVTHLLAIMEPSLLRLLAKVGIYFKPLGSLVDYHGMRQPCYTDIETLLARVYQDRHDVWRVITDDGLLLEKYRKKSLAIIPNA